ncbi:MAG: ECF transporter S component [Ruminococcus sp.]|nr:ECF transporter S component [Ruminococcus sp.]
MSRERLKRLILPGAFVLLSAGGAVILRERSVSWLLFSAAVLGCAVIFETFERREDSSNEVAAAAVMTALCVAGRLMFAFLPAVKPCMAVITISGIYLGAGQGAVIGALSMLVSNFYFSQGMWTPFQMLLWGLTGLGAGALSGVLRKSRAALCLYGLITGVAFSLLMDVWSTFWADNGFTLRRFLSFAVTSAGFTAGYAVSNAVFLLVLIKPAERIFERLYNKYGIGSKR